jgi:hypothetical protein
MHMGILNFFKKKEIVKEEIKIQEININEIESWLENKTGEINDKEKEIFNLIKKESDLFNKNIREKIKVLEEIDIESKKVDDRTKIIVEQGLKKYLNFVHIFIRELNEIKKENLWQFIKDINKIFLKFEKPSYVFYQRANFLIGNELAAVKEEINDFSKYFERLFKEYKKTINSTNIVSSTKFKLKKFDEAQITIKKSNLERKSLDERISEGKNKERKITDEIDRIKTSKNYLENLKKQEEIMLIEKEINRDILKLKTFIDFKTLSNTFHSDRKNMEIIKNFKENFKENIEKNKGQEILELIDEVKLNNETLKKEMGKIEAKKQKISERKKLVENDKIEILSEELKKTKLEIEDLNLEKNRLGKRNGEIKEDEKEILELIKFGVGELDGKVKNN